MRHIKLLVASVLLMSVAACVADKQSDLDMLGYIKTINIVGPDEITFEQMGGAEQTKATSVNNGSALVFNWAVGDTLGIFPNKGNQVEFPITAQEGSTSASFDGGGWALRNNASYAAYYPFSVWNYFQNNKTVIMDYSGQVQNGNGSFEHLSAYDFLASAKTTPRNSTVTFQMDRQGSILYIDIVVPEPATITSLTISCNEAIFVEKAALDISGNTPVVTPIETKESLTLSFVNTTTTETNETVRAYMAVQPLDFSSKTVTATLITDADTYTAPVVSRVVNKGKAAFLRFSDSFTDGTNDPTTPPDNEIWYTSTDGNIVVPDKSDVFGATIVSNTYQDGKGVIRFYGAVTTIGYSAFANCKYLRTVELPASVTTIGGTAFFQCYSLSDVSLPEGLTRIEANAFLACKNLSDITLPGTLVYIGTDAFLYCSSLTTVHIPESVTSLWSAFTGCSSLASFTGKYASADGRCLIRNNMMVGFAPAGLTTYTVPANVTVIYNEVFRSCKLEEVILPEGLKELYSAFFYCDNLKSIVIPSTVNKMTMRVLDNCPALTEIVIMATVPPTCSDDELFPETNNCPIYVPAESVNAYKTAEHWSVYADRIQAIPDNTIPEAVDLGLTSGLKWATCNVGASAPEEYGDYFAWGETEPYYTEGHSQDDPCSRWKVNKTGYNWASYKFELGTDYHGPFSKYVTNSSYGTVDNNTVLDLEDDAASVNWGGTWRMPTDAEWTELRTECTWTWTTRNGVNGRLVTGPNGNSIFLPAAGYRYNTNLYFTGSSSCYWSSSLSTGSPYFAWHVSFFSDEVCRDYYNRFNGQSVRPVTDEGVRVSVTGVSLNKDSLDIVEGGTASLIATVTPSNATQPNVIWTSSNISVATVDYTGKVTAVASGTATITAKTYDGGFTATCTVTVSAVPEAVDLGLTSGLKWASCNVGASAPEEYGDYFAWGETEPYYTEGHSQDDPCSNWRGNKTGYNWASYKFELGTDYHGPFSKYVTDSSYGTVDNNTVLDPEDDAATVNWGGTWRMPTIEEWQELIDECTWTWTTQNGVSGRLVTGPNGNSIFLPAAGSRYDTGLGSAGSLGNYWSSLAAGYPRSACYVYFSSGNFDWGLGDRYRGFSVRPVTDEGVRVSVTGISLNKSSLSLFENETETVTATVTPSNATQPNVIWSSSNTSVATVDYTGKVTAMAAGTAIITAKTYDGGFTATCLVTAVAPGGGNEGTTEEAWN